MSGNDLRSSHVEFVVQPAFEEAAGQRVAVVPTWNRCVVLSMCPEDMVIPKGERTVQSPQVYVELITDRSVAEQ